MQANAKICHLSCDYTQSLFSTSRIKKHFKCPLIKPKSIANHPYKVGVGVVFTPMISNLILSSIFLSHLFQLNVNQAFEFPRMVIPSHCEGIKII